MFVPEKFLGGRRGESFPEIKQELNAFIQCQQSAYLVWVTSRNKPRQKPRRKAFHRVTPRPAEAV